MPEGAMNFDTALNICPTNPCGVQFAIAMTPPGLQTRRSSAATRSGRGANMAPIRLVTMSNSPSGKGRGLRIGLVEPHGQVCRFRARARAVDQIAGDIYAGDVQSVLGGHQSQLTRAAADVEKLRAGSRGEPLIKLPGAGFQIA